MSHALWTGGLVKDKWVLSGYSTKKPTNNQLTKTYQLIILVMVPPLSPSHKELTKSNMSIKYKNSVKQLTTLLND